MLPSKPYLRKFTANIEMGDAKWDNHLEFLTEDPIETAFLTRFLETVSKNAELWNIGNNHDTNFSEQTVTDANRLVDAANSYLRESHKSSQRFPTIKENGACHDPNGYNDIFTVTMDIFCLIETVTKWEFNPFGELSRFLHFETYDLSGKIGLTTDEMLEILKTQLHIDAYAVNN